MSIGANLAEVKAQLDSACGAVGRSPDAVTLVAVSKRHPADAVAQAYAAGQRDFGENQIQELEEKRSALAASCPDIRWHFIGRVQRNKAERIATAALVHGAGAIRNLDALARHGPVDVLLQVNLGAEDQKNGFAPRQIADAVAHAAGLEGLRLRGLMTIPPQSERPALSFAQMRTLFDAAQAQAGEGFNVLSMGMSADFSEAVAAGATHVRVGTAIFGARAP